MSTAATAVTSETQVIGSAFVQDIPVKAIRINQEFNARLKYENIEELAAEIKRDGLLQNIVVRANPDKEGQYWVVAGHRRFLAISKHLDWDVIPCVVREFKAEPDAIFANLAENVTRRSLSGYELACKFYELQTTYDVSGAVIANRLQEFSRGYVNNLLRIMENVNPGIIGEWKDGHPVATVDFLISLAKLKAENGKPDFEAQNDKWKAAVKARKVNADSDPDAGSDGDGGDEEGGKGAKGKNGKAGKEDEKVLVRIKRQSHEVVGALIDNIRDLDKSGALVKMIKREQMGDFVIACLKFSLGRPKKVKVGDFVFDPAAPDEEEAEAEE